MIRHCGEGLVSFTRQCLYLTLLKKRKKKVFKTVLYRENIVW